MESLADRVAGCERCGLAQVRQRAIAGECPAGATVLLIAAAPSFPAELVGRALSDEAREVLTAAGVDMATVATTTLVKCRPPAGRSPTDEEIAACRPFLEEQVAEQRPETVIALGGPVLRSLAPGAPPLSTAHGHSRPVTIGDHEARLLPVLDPYAIAEVPSLAPLLVEDFGGPAPAATAAPAPPAPEPAEPADEPPAEVPPQLGLF
jgi:uracil-DNA glycosylase family 4